ncbi:MAG: penicillin-binding protein [Hespellia sp.]|nr:penicillin-binding protein [Hespellia sp.]
MFNRLKDMFYDIIKSRLFVMIVAFCFLFAILINRVFYLQIVKGQDYLDNYKLQIMKTRTISGTRGNIYDRNGNLLAYNELAYSVTIEDNITSDSRAEKNEILNEILEKIIAIVESNGDSVISDFGIILDKHDNYTFNQSSETQKLRFIADVYGKRTIDELTEKQKSASADSIMKYLCTDEVYGYGIDQKAYEKPYILKLVNLRYAIGLNSYQKYIPTTLASDVSDETVAAIMENIDQLQGVDIAEDSLRRYTDSKYFASVIGYTGKISQEEYDALDKGIKEKYSLTDIVGKSGLEQYLDETLQGTKGEVSVYVDSVGKVTEMVSNKDPEAGNDVYLTLDKDLQEQTYQLIEEKLAGILLSKITNVMNYDPSTASSATEIIIPIDDVYFAFIGNEILDLTHFSDEEAKPVEQQVYAAFTQRKESATQEVLNYLRDPNAAAYRDLSLEMQAYMNYISSDLLTSSIKILNQDAIDTSDETYQAWTTKESINLYSYLNYAISQNWVDTSKLRDYVSEGKYSDSNEVYESILAFLEEYLNSDSNFDKLLYKYLIKSGGISGSQICAMVYEQEVLPMDEEAYQSLAAGGDSFAWIYNKIQRLEITPGQLAVEPCTGSAVVSDVNTGEVLACVSYPGYDNNRLANTMDSAYYNQLVTGLSRPFYNNATQERTAPGSTFKMVSSVAGLTEGIITDNTIFECHGIYDKVEPNPKCWIYPGAHGGLNVINALEVSCNSFYYEIGYQLGLNEEGTYSSDRGVEKLAKYAEAFGLGETSGIEIPESSPQISDEASVPTAIGQGTHNYTVAQLNRYVAAVANSGTVHKLSLLNKVTDIDGRLIKEYKPEITNEMSDIPASTWNLIHQGMEDMVSSSSTFVGVSGITIAGKTGTAQQSETHADHALFVGYAPADNPEIAVSVRIANGYSSSYATEIARDIIQCKYQTKEISELITGTAAELGTAIQGD